MPSPSLPVLQRLPFINALRALDPRFRGDDGEEPSFLEMFRHERVQQTHAKGRCAFRHAGAFFRAPGDARDVEMRPFDALLDKAFQEMCADGRARVATA